MKIKLLQIIHLKLILLLILIIYISYNYSFLYIKSQLSLCSYIWLHPPKTGSTFCLSIQHICNETDFTLKYKQYEKIVTYKGCAVLYPYNLSTYKGSNWHSEITNFTNNNINNHITILRNPKKRLISSFCDFMHFEGMKKLEGNLIRYNLYKKLNLILYDNNVINNNNMTLLNNNYINNNFKFNNIIINEYITNIENNYKLCQVVFDYYISFFPNNYGCYTKMLNGYGCYSNNTINANMVNIANHLLNDFAFVGILEEYNKSLKLFYKLNEDKILLPPLDIETLKIRQRNSNFCRPLKYVNICMNTDMNIIANKYHDPYDTQVYKHARNKFRNDLIQYKL